MPHSAKGGVLVWGGLGLLGLLGAMLGGCEWGLSSLWDAGSRTVSGTGKKQAFLLGAPELPGEGFFLEDLRELAPRLQKAGFALSGAVGSRARRFGRDFVPFDVNQAWKQLEKTLARTQSGEEFLLVIHSHGRDRYVEVGQRTHSVAGALGMATQGERLGRSAGGGSARAGAGVGAVAGAGAGVGVGAGAGAGPEGVFLDLDLDLLFPLLRGAHGRGVRIGIVDLSCYSGESQRLREVASCVATLAAPGYVSLCSGREEERGFSSFFMRGEHPKTLRARFLDARLAEGASVNVPALSEFDAPWSAAFAELLVYLDPLDLSEAMQAVRPRSKKTKVPPVLRVGARAAGAAGAAGVAGVAGVWVGELASLGAELEGQAAAARATRGAIDRELEALEQYEKAHRLTFSLPRSGRKFAGLSAVMLEGWLARIEEGGAAAGMIRSGAAAPSGRVAGLSGSGIPGAALPVVSSGDAAEDSAIAAVTHELEAVWQQAGAVLVHVRERQNRLTQLQEKLWLETEALMKAERRLYDARFRGAGAGVSAGAGVQNCDGFRF